MPSINQARLAELERKERAHDDYMAATKDVKAKLAAHELRVRPFLDKPTQPAYGALVFVDGYRQCLRDWAAAIVSAAAEHE